MKETVKVNLNGQLFDLDSDAYEKLKRYLDTLHRKFGVSPEEAGEIIEDIEARIAELLATRINEKKQVITLADVEEIISQLGTPEELEDEEIGDEEKATSAKSSGNQTTHKKRFYRDTENSILGGVGSGLGAYFNIDPIWIRLLFVVLFFANLAGLLIYIVLWVVIPPARTTAQKLEMQGKPVNINNIEESVKEEFNKVSSSIKNIPNSKGYKNIESGLSEFFRALGNILLVLLKIVGIIVGVSLLLAFIFTIIGVVAGGALFFPGQWFNNWNWFHFGGWPHLTLAGMCLLIIVILPIIAVLVKIVKLMFGVKTRNNVAAGLGATVWVVALITFIVLIVTDIERGTFRNTDYTEYYFEIEDSNTLYIDVDLRDNSNHQLEYYQFFDREFVWDEWSDDYLDSPEVILKRSTDDRIKLEIHKSYLDFQVGKKPSGWNKLADYNWRVSDSRLVLDEYYSVDEDYIWRLPKVKVVVIVPEDVDVVCSNRANNKLDVNCNSTYETYEKIEEIEDADNVRILKSLEESEE